MLRSSYIKNDFKRDTPKTLFSDELENNLEDDKFVGNIFKPLNENEIKKISTGDLEKFIDNVLLDEEINNLLFSSNAKSEINMIKKASKQIVGKKDQTIVKEINPQDLIARREKEETIKIIVDETNRFKQNKRKLKMDKENKSYQIYKKYYKDYAKMKEAEYTEYLRECRSQRFLYIFESVKNRVKNNKGVTLPKVDLNLDDVYSRLFHNKVFTKKRQDDSIRETIDSSKGKIIKRLNVKNVINETSGKEFSIKITDKEYFKCFYKHSGGPKRDAINIVCFLYIG